MLPFWIPLLLISYLGTLLLIARLTQKKSKQTVFVILLEKVLPGIIFDQAKNIVDKQTMGNYPAPYKILETVKEGWLHGKEKGIQAEVKNFDLLLKTPESKELIGIFFNMTLS